MRKATRDSFPAIIGGGLIILALFFHSIYEDLLKAAVLKHLSAVMGMPEAELVSRLTEMAGPIVGAVAVIWIVLWYARRELRAELPDPSIEARRQHTAAIVAQTEALKAKPHSPVLAQGVDDSRTTLAGIVNGLLERSLQRDFKIPASPSDSFLKLYEEVKNSTHPAWIDPETNQLRRDVLQYCGIVGMQDEDRKEHESNREQLQSFGQKLIQRLAGVTVSADLGPDVWKPAPEAIEAFSDSALIATRDKWALEYDSAVLKGFAAEDELADIRKKMMQTESEATLGNADRIQHAQRKLSLYAMMSDNAMSESKRAWDALRDDIHSKLVSGALIAKGFRQPHTGGTAEIEISKSEWRILSLNNVTSEAFRKGGSEVLYAGLIIRKNEAE
jgi:hypothetical protein